MSCKCKNENSIKLGYLAYKFSGDPTENTKIARDMALRIMQKHPDIWVIVPHFTVDGLLDGTVEWTGKTDKQCKFTKERRLLGGLGSVMIISKIDILILGCEPEYAVSSGVTWEWVITHFLNRSYRKDNPIEITTYEEMVK